VRNHAPLFGDKNGVLIAEDCLVELVAIYQSHGQDDVGEGKPAAISRQSAFSLILESGYNSVKIVKNTPLLYPCTN